MKKILLWILWIIVVLALALVAASYFFPLPLEGYEKFFYSLRWDKQEFQQTEEPNEVWTDPSLDQRIYHFIKQNFSSGYSCDEIADSKYFFATWYFPAINENEYVVSRSVAGYCPTPGKHMSICGGGAGDVAIVRDMGTELELLHYEPVLKPGYESEVLKPYAKELEYGKYSPDKQEIYDFYGVDFYTPTVSECPAGLCDVMRYWWSDYEEGVCWDVTTYLGTRSHIVTLDWDYSWSELVLHGDGTYEVSSSREDSNMDTFVRWNGNGTWSIVGNNVLRLVPENDPSYLYLWEIVEIGDGTLKLRRLYM